MIHYSLEYDGKGTIEFWTDSKEIVEDVSKYIRNVVDAVSWRNQVARVQKVKDDNK